MPYYFVPFALKTKSLNIPSYLLFQIEICVPKDVLEVAGTHAMIGVVIDVTIAVITAEMTVIGVITAVMTVAMDIAAANRECPLQIVDVIRKEVEHYKDNKKEPVIVVLGNKSDIEASKRQVETVQAPNWAAREKVKYLPPTKRIAKSLWKKRKL